MKALGRTSVQASAKCELSRKGLRYDGVRSDFETEESASSMRFVDDAGMELDNGNSVGELRGALLLQLRQERVPCSMQFADHR